MDPNTFPTKGNLILAKNALALSKQGFDLMDKKRNILIRELFMDIGCNIFHQTIFPQINGKMIIIFRYFFL